MAIKQSKMQHVVAIPYPAQGHINPMLQLCQQLIPLGFTFTFINTHHIHQRVQRARQTYPAHPDVIADDTREGQGAHAYDAHHELHPHTPGSHHTDDVLVPHAYQDEGHCTLNGRDDPEEPAPGDAALQDDAHQYNGCSSIRMVFVAGGCAPEQHARPSGWSEVFNAAQEMQEPVEELISQIMQEQGVAFILSDIMLRWCSTTANKFRLPWVCFWPASGATCSVLLYFADLATEGKGITFAEKEAGIMEGIPGLPPTHLYDLPKVWDSSTWKLEHVVLDSFKAAKEACFLLLNTFEEIEGQVLEALRQRLPTVALGPLLPSHYMLHTCPDSSPPAPLLSLFPEDRTCLAWLDTQPPSSVLFISFGSISLRSHQQLHELALGVHATGCPFLWALRPGISTGFTHDDAHRGHPRGLIVPWAPQLQVLSHPSVGGFITHCGWNSVVESVSMGVPMLCWADTGERMSNQRFVVDFWKCGVHMVTSGKRVTQHIDEAVLVGRDEVEKSVKFLMFEDAGAPIRARAAQLKAIAARAFQDSQTHFKEFVQAMEQKRLHMPSLGDCTSNGEEYSSFLSNQNHEVVS